jgi:hypothetical protein
LEENVMAEFDEHGVVRDAADTVVEYESNLEGYVQRRPLTAVAAAIVVGALLAKFLF